MKKLLSFILLIFIILTSCVSQTITHETNLESDSHNTSDDTENTVENTPVSDIFPVKSLNIAGNSIGLYTVVYPSDAENTVKYAEKNGLKIMNVIE
mgnify:CR=1 FL=1